MKSLSLDLEQLPSFYLPNFPKAPVPVILNSIELAVSGPAAGKHSLLPNLTTNSVILSFKERYTETWLSNTIFDYEIVPAHYTIFRNDRPTRGGGVMITIKDCIPVTFVSKPTQVEAVSVCLEFPNPIILCCLYIPPNPSRDLLEDVISYLSNLFCTYSNHDIVLVGDFNLPDINWNTLSATSYTSEQFCDFVFIHNLSQLVDKPTHRRGNILDLVLTNSETRFLKVSVSQEQHLLLSDHFIISFQLTKGHLLLQSATANQEYVFDFTKADFASLCSYLMDTDFSPCLLSNDIEFIWSIIKNAIYSGMNLFIPKVRLRKHQFPRWFTPELRHLTKRIRTLRKRISKHPSLNCLINSPKWKMTWSTKLNPLNLHMKASLSILLQGNAITKSMTTLTHSQTAAKFLR